MKRQLLFLLIFLIVTIGYSQTFIDNNITYTVTSTSTNTVEVVNYNINGGQNVVIPETVTPSASSKFSETKSSNKSLVTYTVTSIGNQAFFNKTITSVTIPDTVTSIGSEAFADNSLSSVHIGNGVQTIEFRAFGNNQLTNIFIPNSVSDIALRAFETNSITSVTIPSNVANIGAAAFRYNPISCVYSEGTTPPTISTGGINDTFNSNRTSIDLSIPSGTTDVYTTDVGALWTGFGNVTEISGNTFIIDNITYLIHPTQINEVTVTNYNIAGGTIVDIPATVTRACISYSVTNIGAFAMDNLGLTSVTLPNTILTIGENAFAFNNLPSITIPDSVLTIDDGAFVQNNNMTSATIGNNVTSIGAFAFRFNGLQSISIPNSVLSIGARAFETNAIATLTLSTGLSSISDYAFAYNNISSVIIPDGVTTIGEFAFNNNNLTSLTIPEAVTQIGGFAFSTNQLTIVTIPQNITNIGNHAFQNNPLTDVYSLNMVPPTIITGGTLDTFAVDRSAINLHIPPGTSGAYVTDPGALWINFNSVTENALGVSNFELLNDVKLISASETIEIITSKTIKLKNYKLFSISGAEILKGNSTTISKSFLAHGVYILKLHFDKGTVTKKVLVY